MYRSISPVLACLALICAAATLVVEDRSSTTSTFEHIAKPLVLHGDWEFDRGTIAMRGNPAHPTAHVWRRVESGITYETRVYLRPGLSDGFVHCGTNDTSVDITYEFLGEPTHTDDPDFIDWVENQYPGSMNIDPSVDFYVVKHTLQVIQI